MPTTTIVVDPSKSGLEKVLTDYEIEALRVVWGSPDNGFTSREVHVRVNEALEGIKTISRSSIINFLNDMCDECVLNYEEETCKGGSRRKYSPRLDEDGFKRYIAKMVFESLLRDFPDQTIVAFCDSLRSDPAASAKFQECIKNYCA